MEVGRKSAVSTESKRRTERWKEAERERERDGRVIQWRMKTVMGPASTSSPHLSQ